MCISYQGANILRDLRGNVKLADFGASKRLQVTNSSAYGSSLRARGMIFLWFQLQMILTFGPINESHRAVLSSGTVNYAVQGGSNF